MRVTRTRVAVVVYAAAAVTAAAFQIALAAGAPLGAYAMGGAFPGRFPPGLRIAALVQAAIILATAVVVASAAGVVSTPSWRASSRLIPVVVGFAAVSLILNLATPSTVERAIWAPVAAVLLVASAIVAVDRRGRTS